MRVVQLVTMVLGMAGMAMCGYSNDEMIRLVQKNGRTKSLSLTETNYEKILNGPRDYHLVMLLSSVSPQFNCPLCIEFKPEFDLVANSWAQDHPDGIGKTEGKDIYFLNGEFMEAKLLFQKLKLNNIPKVFYVKPSTVATQDAWLDELEEYQFFQGQHSQLVISWLRDLTGHKFNLYVPINYNRIVFNAAVTFGLLVLARVFFKQIKAVFASKVLWTGVSIVSILLFTSGYMFNQIRLAPYVREHPDGRVEYFLAGQQMQVGIETQIISFVYGLLSILLVALVKKVPEIKHPQVQLAAAAVATAGIYVIFSFFLSVFAIKSQGYPYKLLRF